MRSLFNPQPPLFSQWPNHQYDGQLKNADKILDRNLQSIQLVYDDLLAGKENGTSGANGMTAEQVLRAGLIKQQNCWSYQELAINCADSGMTRAFVRLDDGQTFRKSCLQENISKIRGETWYKINELLVLDAKESDIEAGRTVRIDATVIEANIHYPTDSSLLFDCIKVANRVLKSIREEHRGFRVYSPVKVSSAKKLVLKIINAKNSDERKGYYRKLLRMAKELEVRLPNIIGKLIALATKTPADLERHIKDIKNVVELLPLIIGQTEKRIIQGKEVPPEEKIVSIFEVHTDIISKGKRETEFGHKVFLTAGKSGLILDCQLVQGNPGDSEYFMDLIERQKQLYGRAPRQTTADGGFASEENVLDAKIAGVTDVCFSKRCGMTIEEMVKSQWVFEKLRNFRAGIEGLISVLKRAFGLDRAMWKGVSGFASYVHSAVAAYNLAVMSRHMAAADD